MSVFNDGGARPRSSSLPARLDAPQGPRELLSLDPGGAPVSWEPLPLPAHHPAPAVPTPDDPVRPPAPADPVPATIAADEVDKAREAATHQVAEFRQALDTALRHGVDVARKNFLGKLLSVAAGSVMLGLAIAATVATAGAAAPLVAFTGVRLLMSVADARAARECVNCAEANAKGGNLKPPPLGPNALGNWLHARLVGRGYTDDKAKVHAAYGSTAVALGLFALTAALTVPATAAKLSVKAAKTATLGLMALVWGNDTWVIAKGDRQRVTIDEARQNLRDAERALQALNGGHEAADPEPAKIITPAVSQARAESQEARGIGRGVGLASVAAGLVNDLNAWLD